MRHSDIPYVKQVPRYYPPEDYKKMTLDKLIEKYIKTCGKAGGDLSVCSKCTNVCEYAKRAIQLKSGEIYDDPPIPLYGGKTLIEMAKEQNMLRRAEKEKKEMEEAKKMEEPKPVYKRKVSDEGWYEESLASGDQVKWLMENRNLSKTQAKKKLYMFKYNHGMLNRKETPVVKVEEPVVEKIEVKTEPVIHGDDVVLRTLEQKINVLMRQQEEYKTKMEEYTRLYNQTKEQVDVLCKSMDILDGVNV